MKDLKFIVWIRLICTNINTQINVYHADMRLIVRTERSHVGQ